METLEHTYESVRSYIPPDAITPSQNAVLRRLAGFGASPGVIEGPCTVARDLKDLQALPYGAIVVCEAALPEFAHFIPLLGGLIAERGGCLSIASRYARECGIPAVFGVEGLLDAVQSGDVIRVDASTGTVDIIG
mgnify:CR=1 FL=1